MTKYVALLRGIGPGNPNMKGESLKAFFEGLGYSNVQTLLASGNVLFESGDKEVAAMESQIEKALPERLGFNSSTIIRSQAELQKLIDHDPYKGQERNHNKDAYMLVTFFKTPTEIFFKLPHKPADKPYIVLGQVDNAIYGTVDLTAGKTPDYMLWLEKQFGKDITSRTFNTIQRILAKMSAS